MVGHTLRQTYHKSIETGLTASTTQTQGNGILTAEINVISVVAKNGDVVTLPSSNEGLEISVINSGAKQLQIFPASGDNLGKGLNAPITLKPNKQMKFFAIDDTNWFNEGISVDSGTMEPAAFGEMVEDNSAGSNINTTTKLWDTANVGELDPNGIVTYLNTANGDELKIGTGGAGTYQIHFSCTFTNAGGNLTKAGIHKNGTQVDKLEDSHAGDSAAQRDLRGSGFLVLADNDLITLHVISATPSDLVKIYHGHITLNRIT